jgi:hypothetical protein
VLGLALRPGFRLKARSPSIEPPGPGDDTSLGKQSSSCRASTFVRSGCAQLAPLAFRSSVCLREHAEAARIEHLMREKGDRRAVVLLRSGDYLGETPSCLRRVIESK